MQCTLVASLYLFAFLPAGGSLSYWLGVILILVVILSAVLFVGSLSVVVEVRVRCVRGEGVEPFSRDRG